jgi:hypothetical protein
MSELSERTKVIAGVIGLALLLRGAVAIAPELNNPVAFLLAGFLLLIWGLKR